MPIAFTERDEDGRERRIEYFGVDGQLFRKRNGMVDCDAGRFLAFNRFEIAKVHPFFGPSAVEIDDRITQVRRDSSALAKRRILPVELAQQYEDIDRTPFRLPLLSSLDVREVGDVPIEETVERFSRRMARVISVEGKVMFREQEPVIEIVSDMSTYSPSIGWSIRVRQETEPLLPLKRTTPGPVDFVALSGFDSLPERLETIARRFGVVDPSRIREADVIEIEVNDASYLTGEAEAAALTVAGRMLGDYFINSLNGPKSYDDEEAARKKMTDLIVGMDLSELELAQRMLSALSEEDLAISAERLEPVMEDFAARAVVGDVRKFGKDAMIEHAVDALERWHDREAGLNIAIAPTFRV